MDNNAQPTTKSLIRGDVLMNALIYLERAYATLIADPTSNHLPGSAMHALKTYISHHYGDAHWYGHAALVAHERSMLDPWDQQTRRAATFYIEDVAKNAIDAACDFPRGPSQGDRTLLINGLTAYLKLFADGKIQL